MKPNLSPNTPRLSEDLAGPRDPGYCQSCGRTRSDLNPLAIWQEHDHNDQRECRYLILCEKCADKIIEPHARLYRRTVQNEPAPGVMPICIRCTYRDGVRCKHPDLKANGGAGLKLEYDQPSVAFMDGRGKNGKRVGWTEKIYHAPVRGCIGREEIQIA